MKQLVQDIRTGTTSVEVPIQARARTVLVRTAASAVPPAPSDRSSSCRDEPRQGPPRPDSRQTTRKPAGGIRPHWAVQNRSTPDAFGLLLLRLSVGGDGSTPSALATVSSAPVAVTPSTANMPVPKNLLPRPPASTRIRLRHPWGSRLHGSACRAPGGRARRGRAGVGPLAAQVARRRCRVLASISMPSAPPSLRDGLRPYARRREATANSISGGRGLMSS
jgi:hypothetical protein